MPRPASIGAFALDQRRASVEARAMGWRRDWQSISVRIEALTRAAEVYAATLRATDIHSVQGKAMQPERKNLRIALSDFVRTHKSELPKGAADAVNRYLIGPFADATDGDASGATLVVPLATLRAEVDYLIHDRHEEARTVAELAFEHLRRSIAVDDDVRRKWRAAFDAGETGCERLGAVHLLSHGIWAFKVSAIGAATDLVFNDPIERHASEVERTARGLVVTEWKIVRQANERDDKAEEARAQLKLYAGGALADLTLTSTRYVVLVSDKGLPAVGDVRDGDVRYRHIVLPVDPDSPSVEARAAARTG